MSKLLKKSQNSLRALFLLTSLTVGLCSLQAAGSYTLTNSDVTIIDGIITSTQYPIDNYSIVIPEMLQGQTVVGIGESAFYAKRITAVTIPNTVTVIGDKAFAYNDIKSLDIPASVVTIGASSFVGSPISSLTLSDNGNLKTIGEAAFKESRLSYVNLPASLENIGPYAFVDSDITTITFPANSVLNTIGAHAFDGNRIKTLDLPASLIIIQGYAFYKNNITNISFQSTSSIIEIGEYAFKENKLSSLSFPASLENIGWSAFQDNSIKTITFEKESNLRFIDNFAFQGNIIQSLDLPKSLTSIGSRAFRDNRISSVLFEEGSLLDRIGEGAFINNRLEGVELPVDLLYIGAEAFVDNKILTFVLPGDEGYWRDYELGRYDNQTEISNLDIAYYRVLAGEPGSTTPGLEGWIIGGKGRGKYLENPVIDLNTLPHFTVYGSATKDYDGTNVAHVVIDKIEGSVPEDLLTVIDMEPAFYSDKNVGDWFIRSDYLTVLSEKHDLFLYRYFLQGSISPANLEVIPVNKTVTYGDTPAFLTYEFKGFGEGENILNLLEVPSISCVATKESNAGSYDIIVVGGRGDNYHLVHRLGIYTIEKATLLVTTPNQTRVYGQANPALPYSITGFISGESEAVLTQLPTVNTVASPSTKVGNYDIIISGGDNTNYTYQFENAQLAITPAPLTIDATVDTKNYNGSNLAQLSNVTFVGLLNNDQVSLDGDAVGYFADVNVGKGKTVTTDLRIAGPDAGNYIISSPSFKGDIQPKNVYVTDARVLDKESDGTYGAIIEDYKLDGVLPGDDLGVGYTATFASNKIGDNISVIADWDINGTSRGNYNLVSPPALYGSIGSNITVMCKWGYVIFINNENNIYERYQWSRNGVEIPGATMQKYYTGDKTLCGTYSCRVSYTRNGGEQVRYTADYTFSHNCDAATVAIYPTILKKGSYLTIQKDMPPVADDTNYQIYVYNLSGQLVLQENVCSLEEAQVACPPLAGLYLVHVMSEGKLLKSEKITVRD